MSLKLVKSRDIANSSQIKKVGMTESGDLFVTFSKGTEYLYKNVPNEIYEDLVKAESVGKFLNMNVKGKYEYVQLPQEQK